MGTIPALSLGLMHLLVGKLEARSVPYLWGGKAPSPGCDSNDITRGLDCSGLSEWLANRATDGALILPEGSANQHQWCLDQGLHKVDYRNIGEYGVNEDGTPRLFICFEDITPEHSGHVWYVDGSTKATMESYGHHGPGSRPYDLPMFLDIVSACFELPCEP